MTFPNVISEVHAQTIQTTTQASAGKTVSTTSIDALIQEASLKYNVSYAVMHSVIGCESSFNPIKQSDFYYSFSDPSLGIVEGTREQSFGLAQINLQFNPEVTKEEAEDPVFSINFLAEALSKGQGSKWTCYRDLYES